jgi:hypothetical protein
MPVKVPFARANLAGVGEDIIWKGVMTRPAAKSQLTQPKGAHAVVPRARQGR